MSTSDSSILDSLNGMTAGSAHGPHWMANCAYLLYPGADLIKPTLDFLSNLAVLVNSNCFDVIVTCLLDIVAVVPSWLLMCCAHY